MTHTPSPTSDAHPLELPTEPTRGNGGGRWLAVVILMVASFMDLMDVTIVNVALPSMQRDLGATPAQLQWVVAAYLLPFAVLLITSGRLGDIFGRRRMFLIGVSAFTVLSLAAGVAPTADALVAARSLQGAAAALMIPQVLSIIQAMFASRERVAVFGMYGAVTGLAAVVGPMLGGWLVTSDLWGTGWRSIFLINLPVGVLLVLATMRHVPESRSPHPLRLDLPGVVLSAAAVFLVVFPLVQGRELGWPTWVIAMLVASAPALAVFAWFEGRLERRGGSPVVPMSLFTRPGFSSGAIVTTAFNAGVGGFFLVLALYLQGALGFTAWEAGLVLVPFSVGAMVASGVAVPLAAKAGRAVILVGGVVSVGAMLLARAEVISTGPALDTFGLLVPMVLAGVGLGLVVVPLVDVTLASIAVRDAGAASGVLNTTRQLGQAVGVAVIGVVFFGILDEGPATAELASHAFQDSVWVAVGLFALSVVASLLLPPRAMELEPEPVLELEPPTQASDLGPTPTTSMIKAAPYLGNYRFRRVFDH
jgi:EmrB/QacA subfamily drug resistance transporter